MNPPDDTLFATWWRTTLIAVAATAVLIGLTQPQAALRGAALIAILAAGIAAFSAVRTALDGVEHRRSTRLAAAPTARPPTLLPTNLTDLLRGYEQSGDLSWPVRGAVTTLAGERLWMRGLRLRSTDDEPRIRAVVSPLLWETVRPARTETGGVFVPHVRIPLRMLGTLLDELEAL